MDIGWIHGDHSSTGSRKISHQDSYVVVPAGGFNEILRRISEIVGHGDALKVFAVGDGRQQVLSNMEWYHGVLERVEAASGIRLDTEFIRGPRGW